jgi:hypothetical protein
MRSTARLLVTPLGDEVIIQQAIPGIKVVVGDWWERVDIGKAGEVTTTCAKSMGGRRSIPSSSLSRLTSQPDQITSA